MKERRNYNDKLNAEAVRMITHEGLTQVEVGKKLGIPKGTIENCSRTSKTTTKQLCQEPASEGAIDRQLETSQRAGRNKNEGRNLVVSNS